jgi:prepilin-type N-terminal cleavage/methylation domain-containing protein
MMKSAIRNQKGFTLLEIIVVLAVLGALAAMLAPVVFRYIDDANRSRAQNDVSAIAAAISQMYKDTGRYPLYASGQGKLAHTPASDPSYLTSDPDCDPSDTNLTTCDGFEPEVGSATGWTFSTKADSLTGQLITNASGYATTGPRAWRGPYLETVPETDVWGRSFVVNILKADPADATPEVVVVLSAGANGTIETNADTLAIAGNFVAGGDDVIARVK